MKRREFLRHVGASGLLPSWASRRAGVTGLAACRGPITSGDRPLRGVRVSDGYHVARTDDHGAFALPLSAEGGPFVFVTTPSGYWTERFFVPVAATAAGPVHFRLRRREPSDAYTALYLTDVHLGEGRAEQSYRRFAATIDEINALDPAPSFVWAGGDITLQGGQGGRYGELMRRLRMPVRTGPGNHQMLVREVDPRGAYHRLFGPKYYSFDVAGVHHVVLDGCLVVPDEPGYRSVYGRVSPRELHWLAEDLRHVPEGTPTVVAVHIPLASTLPERRGTTAAANPWWVMTNGDEVLDLMARHDVPLVLQGHLHENERLVRRGGSSWSNRSPSAAAGGGRQGARTASAASRAAIGGWRSAAAGSLTATSARPSRGWTPAGRSSAGPSGWGGPGVSSCWSTSSTRGRARSWRPGRTTGRGPACGWPAPWADTRGRGWRTTGPGCWTLPPCPPGVIAWASGTRSRADPPSSSSIRSRSLPEHRDRPGHGDGDAAVLGDGARVDAGAEVEAARGDGDEHLGEDPELGTATLRRKMGTGVPEGLPMASTSSIASGRR